MFTQIVAIRNKLEELEDTVMQIRYPGSREWEDFMTINSQDKDYWPPQYLLHGHKDWPGAIFRVKGIQVTPAGSRENAYVYGA